MRKKRLLASVATVTVFGVFTRIISFLFKIYLSRTLGAEEIGLYQMALSVFFLFASVSSGGVPMVLSRRTAEEIALDGKPNYSVFSSALIIGLSLSCGTVLVLSLFRNHLSFMFTEKAAYPVFLVTLPALISTAIYTVVRSFLWGKKEFSAFSATETVEELLRVLLGVLFVSGVISGVGGAFAVALAFTASDILIAVILLIIFFAKGGAIKKPSAIKDIFLPSVPITAMRVFSSLMATAIALLLPLRLLKFGLTPSEAAAAYGRVAGMANPLLLAPNAVISSMTVVLIPEMSASGVRREFGRLNRQLNTGLSFSFLVCGLFMTLYIALGRELTTILYADAESGQYLQYAAFMMLPMCLAQITQSALNSIGREKRSFVGYLSGNAVTVALIWLLSPKIGIYSVAVANFCGLLLSSCLNVLALRKAIGFGGEFMKYLIFVTLFVLPSAFLSDALISLLGSSGFLATAAAAFVGLVSYCVLCYCFGLVDVKSLLVLRRKTQK